MKTPKRKTFKEEFARFYESPSRESLRDLLRDHIGELPNLDFKERWPELPKVARHVLGFANLGGGCMIIGIAEREDKTLDSTGIESLIDKSSLMNGIKKFLPAALLDTIDFADYMYEVSEYPTLEGKKFQAIFVEGDPTHLPFLAMADGEGIRNNAIYVRRGTSTEEVNYDELQKIINRRLETGYSSQTEIDLRRHIEHLKLLYSYADLLMFPELSYGQETFNKFIMRMIQKKKS